MEDRSHALLAGLFTVLLGLALLLSIWWFGGSHESTRDYTVISRQNVTGLSVQGQVRYRGIRVGKVEAIELDPEDVRNIIIRISVNSSLPLTRGTTARLGYQGVTGIAHVLLEDTGSNPTPLDGGKESPPIAMQPSLVEELSEAGPATLREAREFVGRASQVLDDENRRHLAEILARLEATTGNANQVAVQLQEALSPENLRLLGATLSHAERASAELAPLLIEARRLLSGLQSVSARLDGLIGDPSPEGFGALAPRLNELGGELSATSRQLNRVLQLMEESPQSLLFGPPPAAPGPGEPGFVAPSASERSS